MRKLVILLVCGVLFLTFGCEENRSPIRVIGVAPTGDVKIDAGKKVTQNGLFEAPRKYDIFNENDMVAARIVITQTFPDYSIGTITTRLDGSGTRPDPKVVREGMLCLRTTNETMNGEKAVYKNQKKAFKREYKLMKLRAKSGVFTSIEKTVEDPNAIDSIEYTEVDGEKSESIGIKKK